MDLPNPHTALEERESWCAMSEPKSISERYMEAEAGTDILGAAGMAGRKYGMAMDLWRLTHKPTPHEYRKMAHQLSGKVAKFMKERGLKGKPSTVARQTIAWWIRPKCKVCSGLGFAKYSDAPALSAIPCPSCNGSGISELHTDCNEAARYAVAELDSASGEASAAIKRKLR